MKTTYLKNTFNKMLQVSQSLGDVTGWIFKDVIIF